MTTTENMFRSIQLAAQRLADGSPQLPRNIAIATVRPQWPSTWVEVIARRDPVVVAVDVKALAECALALVEVLLAAYPQGETPCSEEHES